jgi:hypothetical protein
MRARQEGGRGRTSSKLGMTPEQQSHWSEVHVTFGSGKKMQFLAEFGTIETGFPE